MLGLTHYYHYRTDGHRAFTTRDAPPDRGRLADLDGGLDRDTDTPRKTAMTSLAEANAGNKALIPGDQALFTSAGHWAAQCLRAMVW
jgi:hypothetical protein